MTEIDLAALIELCYGAALDLELWPKLLADVAAVVGARGAAIVPQDESRATDVIVSESLVEANAAYMAGWWQHDPWNPLARPYLRRPGVVVRDSELIRPEDKRSNAFFQVFCRRHRLGDFAAGMFLDQRDGASYSVTVFRDPRRGLYAAQDLDRLRVLTPHVAQAFALSAALGEARHHAAGLAAGLHRLRFGTIVLDPRGRAREISAAAERFLRDHLRLDADRRPHARHAGDRERFERLVAATLNGGRPPVAPSMILRSCGDGRPILVETVPLRVGEAALGLVGARRGGALLMLHDLFAPAHPETEHLLTQLGLSPAEARLAQLIGRGHSPKIAARVLGIAESTARVHLRACFSKLGIARQSELAVVVTSLDSLTGRAVDG